MRKLLGLEGGLSSWTGLGKTEFCRKVNHEKGTSLEVHRQTTQRAHTHSTEETAGTTSASTVSDYIKKTAPQQSLGTSLDSQGDDTFTPVR